MLIQLTGEELQIEDERLLDDVFNVELDEDYLAKEKAVIVGVSHDECGRIFEQIDIVYANQSAQIKLVEMKDQKKIDREAMKRDIDI
jgi:hypothetical protein